jgi:hypothetical protein
MATSSPPPAPLAPPDEQFWEKYSPHHEFPLSTVGSVAMHVAALAVFLGLLWMLSRLTFSDKTPVPMRTAMLTEGSGADGRGEGGGTPAPMENVDRPQLPSRDIPEATLQEVKEKIKQFSPVIPPTEGLRPEDLPTAKRLAEINDDLRKKLFEGMNGNKGKGPGDGMGESGVPGAGASDKGDATSSSNRAVRWELIFDTTSGEDYVRQLAAMKATLVIPQPADWQSNRVYRNLTVGNAAGEDFDIKQLPGLFFIDDMADSAARVARALGLNFSPPKFIAFFPKDVEEDLATKERAYRGRKESEIFSTKFRILMKDGKPTPIVIDQVPVRR